MADKTILQKTCNHCKSAQDLTEFYNDKDSRDGLHRSCRSCCAAWRNRRRKPRHETETRTASKFFTTEELGSEEWRTVPGFEKYKVSSLGRIETTHSRRVDLVEPPRILSQRKPGGNGYILYTFHDERGVFPRTLHSIVLEAFVGPCPEGMEGCHENGIRHDCRLANLRWDTRKANHQDSVRHGTHNTSGLEMGRKPRLFKYTAAQLQWVLDNRGTCSQRELSTRSGIHYSTVRRICQGRYNPSTLD